MQIFGSKLYSGGIEAGCEREQEVCAVKRGKRDADPTSAVIVFRVY